MNLITDNGKSHLTQIFCLEEKNEWFDFALIFQSVPKVQAPTALARQVEKK